ncbi:hypothetical protein HX021_14580 [Sphingobacterium sp. N143]|uniref:hypothetical protein n=1 Tax=Sphingobacterium sp. N143 TaxID=2746727 RepID=UPI0025785C32|nr:hypothetical protein [Sphingobacterium sp. N143]MDM1295513.1 hypothetical protein [Sphingobacterium sp. N143]
MKNYVLSLTLSLLGGIAFGQVKLKEHRPLLQRKESNMPILKLDSSDRKYNMPVKKFKRADSLAPMPGTEKMPKGGQKKRPSQYQPLTDTLKVKDFKLKIDSLYPKRQKK